MFRAIFAVILLPSLLVAQTAPPAPAQTAPPQNPPAQTTAPTSTAHAAGRGLTSYTLYDFIRRGTDEPVALQLVIAGFVTTPRLPVDGIAPLQLELDPAEGLTIQKLEYPKAHALKLQFRAERIPLATPPFVHFTVRAGENAALGPHTLKGKLTFQLVFADKGVGQPEQRDFEIPIQVVEHDAKVQRYNWPIHQTTVRDVALDIVLVPVAAVVLPFYLICHAFGACD